MKRKRGGQPGNKNALGNKGGAPIGNQNASGHGAPHGNRNAITHGLYSHTGIYARRAFDYKSLSGSDKALFDEILKDAGSNIGAAENIFRVVKFERNVPRNCKDPLAAMMYSGRLLIECAKQYNIQMW
ncbi:MAG: hypothetical protein K0S76_733 [Herbinix sp.]|jgi:hypothetical protein|nr:hypothetical protein [Herbinix sp.]